MILIFQLYFHMIGAHSCGQHCEPPFCFNSLQKKSDFDYIQHPGLFISCAQCDISNDWRRFGIKLEDKHCFVSLFLKIMLKDTKQQLQI